MLSSHERISTSIISFHYIYIWFEFDFSGKKITNIGIKTATIKKMHLIPFPITQILKQKFRNYLQMSGKKLHGISNKT